MSCEDVERKLSDYALGELDSTEEPALLSHVRDCKACRETLQEIRDTAGLLQAEFQREPVPHLVDHEKRIKKLETVLQP